MDIRQLTYFLTIAEEGQITAAARRLHMAQPPLSQQMKNLEEELGVQLFKRGPRQVQRERAAERPRHLQGADVLVAQHQHLPRPQVGTWARDLRRGSVSDRAAGRSVRQGRAGRRPEVPEGGGVRQALRGALGAGVAAARV